MFTNIFKTCIYHFKNRGTKYSVRMFAHPESLATLSAVSGWNASVRAWFHFSPKLHRCLVCHTFQKLQSHLSHDTSKVYAIPNYCDSLLILAKTLRIREARQQQASIS